MASFPQEAVFRRQRQKPASR